MSHFVYADTSLPVLLPNNSYVMLHTMERPVQPALLEALMNHSPRHENKDVDLKWARSLKIRSNLFYGDIRIDLIFCVSPYKPKVIGFHTAASILYVKFLPAQQRALDCPMS